MVKEKVSVVIPAYNEEKQIGIVLAAVKKSPYVDEIIVIDDGSEDRTAEIAKEKGVIVISQPNGGKGSAMGRGVKEASGDIIVFFDGDLINLTNEHIESLIVPFASDEKLAMTLGKFVQGNIITYFGQEIFPFISGQRGIRKKYFIEMDDMAEKGFGIELAIYDFVKEHKLRFIFVPLPGLKYLLKEEKDGFLKGFVYRVVMYRDIARELFKKKK
jgi:glycosyltransferase involved in cell wall biosynthesis